MSPKFQKKEDAADSVHDYEDQEIAAPAEISDREFSKGKTCPGCGKEKLLSQDSGMCEFCTRTKKKPQPVTPA